MAQLARPRLPHRRRQGQRDRDDEASEAAAEEADAAAGVDRDEDGQPFVPEEDDEGGSDDAAAALDAQQNERWASDASEIVPRSDGMSTRSSMARLDAAEAGS